MEARIISLVEEIKNERRNRRAALSMQPPASSERLQQFCEQAIAKLEYYLPEAYLDLLRLADGIDSNGFLLYASVTQLLAGHANRPDYSIEGFVDANLRWREYGPNNQFVFFAETGDVVYCQNLNTGNFQIMDRIAQEVDSESNVFGTCEKLLERLLNHMLDRYDGTEETES